VAVNVVFPCCGASCGASVLTNTVLTFVWFGHAAIQGMVEGEHVKPK
jgi:hypothetical protein